MCIRDSLYAMDALKSGVGLRGWGQHDPKIVYKIEGGEDFDKMMSSIADEVTNIFFRVHVQERREREIRSVWQAGTLRHDAFDVAAQADRQHAAAQNVGEHKPVEPIKVELKVGRNEPCPCRSGKKYKHCCGRLDR